jgi:lipase
VLALLADGVGITGSGLVRPQTDPQVTPLSAQRFGPPGPPQLLLLHGLDTSSAFWAPVGNGLAAAGVGVIAPAASGFGASLAIGTELRLAAQADAVAALLADADGPVAAAAHSLACARRAARQVARVVARAGVLHSYPSYQGLESPFGDDVLVQTFRNPDRPVTVVLATDDATVPADSIRSLSRNAAVDVVELPGDHLLPVTEPGLVAALLNDRLPLVVR